MSNRDLKETTSKVQHGDQVSVSRRNLLAAAAIAPVAFASSVNAQSANYRSNGKTALVTGSSRGIGAAIAKRLSQDGFLVAVNYVTNAKLADGIVRDIEAAGGKAISVQADVSDPAAVKRLFDATERAFGQIDVVVNNAGIMRLAAIKDMKDEDFSRQFDVNVKGGFNTLREGARRVRDGGRIISTSSSVTAFLQPTYGPYAASKASLEALTSVLSKELSGRKISVNAIAPGPVATPLFLDGKTPQMVESFAKRTPHGRIGEPSDIASVVSMLASDDGAWINGQTIRANGGIV